MGKDAIFLPVCYFHSTFSRCEPSNALERLFAGRLVEAKGESGLSIK